MLAGPPVFCVCVRACILTRFCLRPLQYFAGGSLRVASSDLTRTCTWLLRTKPSVFYLLSDTNHPRFHTVFFCRRAVVGAGGLSCVQGFVCTRSWVTHMYMAKTPDVFFVKPLCRHSRFTLGTYMREHGMCVGASIRSVLYGYGFSMYLVCIHLLVMTPTTKRIPLLDASVIWTWVHPYVQVQKHLTFGTIFSLL